VRSKRGDVPTDTSPLPVSEDPRGFSWLELVVVEWWVGCTVPDELAQHQSLFPHPSPPPWCGVSFFVLRGVQTTFFNLHGH